MTTRKLSPLFMDDLIKPTGRLHLILERVWKDGTLDLEIRDGYINIYYRGGNLLRIGINSTGYVFSFDDNYGAAGPGTSGVADWLAAFPELKQKMDFYFQTHIKDEREFQQLVVRENNCASMAGSTDYFIIDIEYDNHDKECRARFDLIALKWESDGPARKLTGKYSPKLVLIEMKYGDDALSGNAGMIKHLDDFQKFLNKGKLPGLKEEMVGILKQKRELKLISGLYDNGHEITVSHLAEEIEYIFLLVNHDPASSKLNKEFNSMQGLVKTGRYGFTPRMCAANFMGYGLYKENVFTVADFRNRYKDQIFSK